MGTVLATVIVVAAVIVLAKRVRIVPQGHEWAVERLGKCARSLPRIALPDTLHPYGSPRMNTMGEVPVAPSLDVIAKRDAALCAVAP